MYISSPDLSSALQTPIPNFLLYVSVSKNISSAITLHEALDSLSLSLLPSLHFNSASMISLDREPENYLRSSFLPDSPQVSICRCHF